MNKLRYDTRNYFSSIPYIRIIHSNPKTVERITDKRKMPVAVRSEIRHIEGRRRGRPEAYRVMLGKSPVWAVYNAFSSKTQETVILFGPKGESFGRMRA